jgi:hypothetical protein
MRTIVVIGSAIVGASLLSFPAIAQQKTVKACQEEWRANKDANQAKGITEKAYVTQCRAGGSAAKPAPAPAASSSSQKKTATTPAPAATQQKTVKACQEEWRANKDANQAKGITQKAYVTQCRAGGTAAAPAPAPAPAQTKTTTAPAPAPAPSAPPASTAAARPATTAPAGANQYATEVQAKMRCGSGTIVWANLESKIYHFTGYKDYGSTKSGAYMCERDATSQGMRAAKNEKHP